MRRLLSIIAALAVTGAIVIGVGSSASAAAGGPVVLMGIDAEDGGVNGHGPIATYDGVVANILANVTNGGTGLLVFGCTSAGSDNVSAFWKKVATDLSVALTCSEGAGIAGQSLVGFKMIGVASDVINTPSGGLTQAENNALGGRATDIAAFVNGGGGLLGFSSAGLTNPYPYLGGLGSFTFALPPVYSNITATPAGTAAGLSDALDVCCWHDEYITFPSFLGVLATNVATGNAAAIGGKTIVIPPVKNADLAILKTGPAGVTEGQNYSYTLAVTNNGPDAATGVTVTDVLPANATYVSSSVGCTESAGTVTCVAATLANGATVLFTVTVNAGSAGTSIANTATVISNETDPIPASNSSTATTPLNHNPRCANLSAGPNLWPPNHKFKTVTVTGATDADSNPLTVIITGVTQDEPTNGLGDGDTAIDAVLGSGNTVQVRAERSGLGDGRVYRIAVNVTDGAGGSCTGVATVGVPHDQGQGSTPIDSGGVYNSLV